ncbi:uncharacterized protein LOC142355583 [Convolutriloba macropyga]|uniref:uncharacterized protein LOC142355583 n=1 Tax=Convolutriloba macropyga TaxID=536237 RepID=UPI003F520B21
MPSTPGPLASTSSVMDTRDSKLAGMARCSSGAMVILRVPAGQRDLHHEPLAALHSRPPHQPHHALPAVGCQQRVAGPCALFPGSHHCASDAPARRRGLLVLLDGGDAGAAATRGAAGAAGMHGFAHSMQLVDGPRRALGCEAPQRAAANSSVPQAVVTPQLGRPRE